jgi:hypothetical protein
MEYVKSMCTARSWVVWIQTYVLKHSGHSEERSASIFRVKEQAAKNGHMPQTEALTAHLSLLFTVCDVNVLFTSVKK